MKKRILILLLTVAFSAFIFGCQDNAGDGKKDNKENPAPTTAASATPTPTPAATTTPTPAKHDTTYEIVYGTTSRKIKKLTPPLNTDDFKDEDGWCHYDIVAEGTDCTLPKNLTICIMCDKNFKCDESANNPKIKMYEDGKLVCIIVLHIGQRCTSCPEPKKPNVNWKFKQMP